MCVVIKTTLWAMFSCFCNPLNMKTQPDIIVEKIV